MAMIYNNLYDIPTSATRFFNVYGPKQNPKSPYSGFISILLDRLKNDTELTIFGDGEQSRDFVFIEDVIQALILIATSDQSRGQVYNVGTGKRTSLNDLIHQTENFASKKMSISYGEAREGDIKISVSDISKLEGIGYQPNFDLKEGLKKYLEYELGK